jgi:DNA modification methylase
MDGVKADMLFTSPPYSDMREYNDGKDLSVSNISKFIGAYKPYTDYQCVNLGIQRKNHEIVQYWDEYIAKARECGYKLLAWNVWDKMECGSIGQQSAFFPIRHEWIFVFGTEFFEINNTWEKADASIKSGAKARSVRQADGTMKVSSTGDLSNPYKQMESVVQILSEHGEIIKEHPATFPVQLPAEYIKAMTNEGDSVIEPFGGSGSTLIACEQLNRKCYMAELDPHYVEVIIARWEQFTGKEAVLLNG